MHSYEDRRVKNSIGLPLGTKWVVILMLADNFLRTREESQNNDLLNFGAPSTLYLSKRLAVC